MSSKIVVQLKADHLRMCVFNCARVTFLLCDLDLGPLILIYNTDLDILKMHLHINPFTADPVRFTLSDYTLPYWSNPPFLIFDIRALWRSVLSARARMSKIKNGGLDQYGAEPLEQQ